MNTRTIDLAALNTMTKYPSIPTFHALGERGRLTAEHLTLPAEYVVTEKIDGTNARIIVFPASWTGPRWIIGSREELLRADGDLIGNPALDIAKTLLDQAGYAGLHQARNRVAVFYGEVYGGKVTAASKQYTAEGRLGFRLFDIATIEEAAAIEMMANWNLSQIAGWRDRDTARFATEDSLIMICNAWGWKTTPRLTLPVMPTALSETYAWLRQAMPNGTLSGLDGKAGKPEGVVIRSPSRDFIAKVRLEDYERTLGRAASPAPGPLKVGDRVEVPDGVRDLVHDGAIPPGQYEVTRVWDDDVEIQGGSVRYLVRDSDVRRV